jgi:lactate dehydrogenase-like 2-hydroxyacid dehydrogenase
MAAKPVLVLLGLAKPSIVDQLAPHFAVHPASDGHDAALASVAPSVEAIAVIGSFAPIDERLMTRFPKLKIISSFGVGYDHIDARWAGAHGITVTNTPDVLTDEVADTTIALLINTLRELPQAERYLRAGQWTRAPYPLTRMTLRNRRVGIVGMGRIGKAIGKRLEGFGVPIAYHARNRQADVAYAYHPHLIELARDSDVLIVITPGGASTKNLINADILDALGPDGVLINMARGSVVDEPALIAALRERRIASAGLDVFADEPAVPATLTALDHVVLLPHVGSASLHTRQMMDQLTVDNLLAYAVGKPPLTPVPETPWRA